ncbi:MAG: type II toxin-antitoxin system VapC family toxin [Acidobacteriaceae bacterium]
MGLDTAPLIYFIEKHATYLPLVQPFFEAADRGDLQIVTSTLTLTEVLTHPYRHGNDNLAQQYSRILLRARNLRMLAVSSSIAGEAARIRADYGCRTPDAIQLATALSGEAVVFLTNDAGIPSIPTVQTMTLNRLLTSS